MGDKLLNHYVEYTTLSGQVAFHDCDRIGRLLCSPGNDWYRGKSVQGTSGLDGLRWETSFDSEMSKIQARETSSFSDIANTTLADQVESRLKELERNIAVARQFIKLADECSSQVRHEWDLLQQDIRVTSSASNALHAFAEHPKKHETTHRLEGSPTKEKTKYKSEDEFDEFKNETADVADSKTGTDLNPKPTKRHGSKRKEEVGTSDETRGPTVTSKNSFLAKSRPKK